MIDPESPIGLFDSGIGGLTVVREIQKLLPEERLVYFGDTARVPYGSKSKNIVQLYSRQNTKLLSRYNVKMVVIACNTSSSVALFDVKSEFGGPVIDVVGPGVSAAIKATRNGRIGIIATKSTIESQAYQLGIQRMRPNALTFSKACPLLVPLAEEGWEDTDAARLIVKEYLSSLLKEDIDTLVMGCTHYPLLEKVLREAVGSEVALVSSARETALMVASTLQKEMLTSSSRTGDDLFLASDSIDLFRTFYTRIVGEPIRTDFRSASPE